MPRRSARLAKKSKQRRGTKRSRDDFEEAAAEEDDDLDSPSLSEAAGNESESFTPSLCGESDIDSLSEQFEELEKFKFTQPNPTNEPPSKKMKVDRGGFSTKDKALRTIEFIKGRDIRYQQNMVTSFLCGAKSILKKAKTKEKKQNIQEAIGVFNEWICEYEANKHTLDRFDHLSLDIIKKYAVLIDFYNSTTRKNEEREYADLDIMNMDKMYLEQLERAKGEVRALRVTQYAQENLSWDRVRIRHLKQLKRQLIECDIRCDGKIKNVCKSLLYYKRGKLKGLPSRIHLQFILWGYSPDKPCITKLAKKVSKMFEEIKSKHYPSND